MEAPLTQTSKGYRTIDGKIFNFKPWSKTERQEAERAARAHNSEVARAADKRAGLGGELALRELQKVVRGENLKSEPTGSVTSTNDTHEETNPYTKLLAMRRKMNPDYRAQLEEKESAWTAEREAKQHRAELESTKEYKLMNTHAQSAYSAVLHDPDSAQLPDRAELLKIAESGDYKTYWQIVADKKLDENLVTPQKPVLE